MQSCLNEVFDKLTSVCYAFLVTQDNLGVEGHQQVWLLRFERFLKYLFA